MSTLTISTPGVQGRYEAAKWQKIALLLDSKEMEELFESLGSFSLYTVSHPVEKEKALLKKEEFLECYKQYVEELKEGKSPNPTRYRSAFSSVLTQDDESLYAMNVGEKLLIKVRSPVLQLQPHRFLLSCGKLFSMALSEESISFGIQFSYPQLYRDKKGTILKMSQEKEKNQELFKKMMRWVRRSSSVVTLLHEEKRLIAPFRLGRRAFEWIDNHKELKSHGLQVIR